MATTSDVAPRCTVFFFHGLESGPHGSKYQRLAQEFAVTSPDFRELDLAERVAMAERATAGLSEIVAVGSSFGGLVAALLYELHPDRFRGYVLLAPALHLTEGDRIERVPPPARARVLHGTGDDIVPHEAVADWCATHGVPFVSVDDGHRLANSHDHMVALVHEVIAAGER